MRYLLRYTCGLPSDAKQKHRFLFLQVCHFKGESVRLYCDESGDLENSEIYLIAGYLADNESWERFSERWAQELRTDPSIKFLKMRDAHRLGGQFRGWPPGWRDEKIANLTRIVTGHMSMGVASFVLSKDYNDIIKGQVPQEEDNPYWFCFQRIVSLFLPLLGEIHERGARIDFIFDSQNTGIQERAWVLHENWRQLVPSQYQNALGSLTFGRDEVEPPIQAADMLAWHIRRIAHWERMWRPVEEYVEKFRESHNGRVRLEGWTRGDLLAYRAKF